MAGYDQRDHEGLQVVSNGHVTTYPDHEGMNFVPHSDKQTVYYSTAEKEALYDDNDGHVSQIPAKSAKQKRFCGLSKCALIIVVVVVLCVVIGAAVGGGVAASSVSKKSNEESTVAPISTTSATPSYTATASSPGTSSSTSSNEPTSRTSTRSSSTVSSSSVPTATGDMGAYNCPAQNGTSYEPSLSPSTTFEIICDRDSVGGSTGINGGTVVDLNHGVLAYSIEACVDLCVASSIGGVSCTAVTYGANITSALSRGGITGNCFLKSQRARTPYVDNSGQVVMAFISS